MANKPQLRDQRIRVMEGVLAWEGEIGNARLRRLFDLQPVQASRLLADFRSFMGDRITEDTRAKVWRATVPDALTPEMSLIEYARLLEVVDDPCVIDARIDLTEIRPSVFANLRKAALSGKGVIITYASMTTPVFAERTIFPHSIVHIGRRWHARAWCAKRKDFLDFTLGRMRSAVITQELAPANVDADAAWNRMADIELSAHRLLQPAQQKIVQGEYFNGKTSRRVPCRACLVQYIIQELRAAIDPLKETPPEFQIEVSNADELKYSLFQLPKSAEPGVTQ